MRVLFVHGVAEIGGAEQELLRIVDRLPSFGYVPQVVCPSEGPLYHELRRRGIATTFATMVAWRKLGAYPKRARAVKSLRDAIRSSRPSLIHTNDIWWVPQTLRAAEGLGIPVIAHVRQEIEARKVRRYELDHCALVVAVSRNISAALEAGGVSPNQTCVLYSGVDLQPSTDQETALGVRDRFKIPAEALLLGTVANLFPRKGYDVMLAALPAIIAAMPNTHYLIVGQGDRAYGKSLQAQALRLGLADHVHWAGFQESVLPYIEAMDLYVQPSRQEGFGIAVIEAMAMHKPVVATMAGGIPEVVADGQTGMLVPSGDPEALARSITMLLADKLRLRRMGLAGRERVAAMFTTDGMMKQLASMYESVRVERMASAPTIAR